MGTKTRKVWSLLGIGLLLLIAAAYAAIKFFTATIIEKVLQGQLKEGVVWSVDEADLSFFEGLTLYGVQMSHKEGDSLRWHLDVATLDVASLKYSRSKTEREIASGSISVDRPVISVYHERPNFQIFDRDDTKKKSNVPLSATLAALEVSDGYFHYTNQKGNALKTKFAVAATRITMGTGGQLKYDKMDASLTDAQYTFDDSLYKLSIDTTTIQGKEKMLKCSGIHYNSLLSKSEFLAHYGERKSRPDITIKALVVQLTEGNLTDSLRIHRIDMNSPQVLLSRDNRLPLPDRITSLPQDWLQQASIPIQIDTMAIINGSLDIELTGRKKGTTSTLPFKHVHGAVFGIQNIKESAPAFTGRLQAIVLGETEVRLAVRYDYGPKNPWNLVASVGNLDLTRLSPILTNEVGIEMGTGEMTGLDFEMEGNEDEGAGEVDFRYRNLRLEYPESMQEEKSKFKQFLVEATATLFYRKQNPDKQESVLGTFYVERDPQKDFTGQWLDGLTEGMLQTVSKIDPKKARARRDQFKERNK